MSRYPDLGNGIFFAYDLDCFLHPETIPQKLSDVRSRGFAWVNLQLRGGYPLAFDDPRTVGMVARFVEIAHAQGLKVMFQLDPRMLARQAAEADPQLTQQVYNFYPARLEGDAFTCKVDYTGRVRGYFLGLVRVFRGERQADGVYAELTDITEQVEWRYLYEEATIGTPVSMWKPVEPFTPITIYGRLKGEEAAAREETRRRDLLVVTSHHSMAIDWANPAVMAPLYAKALRLYQGIPFDGLGWDEPMSGCCFKNWQSWGGFTAAFYASFQEHYGYDLREKLWALVVNDAELTAPLVRYHYFAHLNTALVERQQEFLAAAQAQYGPTLHMGIHHTCHEMTEDDLNGGSLDVFRACQGVTAGFTDSTFDREDSMLFNTVLAASLGKISASGQAYNNSWNFLPTHAEYDYYTRVYATLGVNWLAHLYGSAMEGVFGFGPGFPHHPTWEKMPEFVGRLNQVQMFLCGKRRQADVAVLYNWESVAALGDYAYMHTHRFALMAAVKELLLAGYEVEILSSELLGAARVAGKELVSAAMGNVYRAVVVAWPFFLPDAAWTRLQEFSRAGGRVILFGYPPRFGVSGKDFSAESAAWLGLSRLPEPQTAGDAPLTLWGESFPFAPEQAEVNYYNLHNHYYQPVRAFPLTLAAGAGSQAVGVLDGQTVALVRGSLFYAGVELSLYPGALRHVIQRLGVEPLIQGPNEVLYGRFCSEDGKELLVLTARGEARLEGTFIYQGKLPLSGCKLAVVAVEPEGLRVVYSF